MKALAKTLPALLIYLMLGNAFADNQTNTTSQISTAPGLPFQVSVEQANFQLPVGLHSGAFGVYQGFWIFIAGRMNGMHGFSGNPFPPDEQNTSIYIVNPATGASYSRSLKDPSAGLSQEQIDSLSVTSPESYQVEGTLYMVGGYGADTARGLFNTKAILTAFNLPGVIQWVMNAPNSSLVNNMQQIYNPIFQITGGRLFKLGNVFELVFGQNFQGVYTPVGNGDYSEQVRQFQITSNGGQLAVNIYNSMPQVRDPNFRRRDMNILPTILNNNNLLQYGLIAYSGVFTETGGAWTVPVVINGIDDPRMSDPLAPTTFKQGMNQYACAAVGFYSRKYSSMYHIFFGGISYLTYSNGTFVADSELPFTNQITTVQMDKNGFFSQYLMANEYPVILSTFSNPGNPLLFGAGAYFIPNNISQYPNRVLNLDNIRQPTVIGFIVGGIQSTVPNTSTESDSAASPYVFKVTLTPIATSEVKKT